MGGFPTTVRIDMTTFGLIVLCSALIFSQTKPLVDNGYVLENVLFLTCNTCTLT